MDSVLQTQSLSMSLLIFLILCVLAEFQSSAKILPKLDDCADPWPNNMLPYEIRADVDREDAKKIEDQLHRLSEQLGRSCMSFKPVTAGKRVIFKTDGPGCGTNFVGYPPSGHTVSIINLGQECIDESILHETMHVLGFDHEHQRHDRDQYVTVRAENIKEGLEVLVEGMDLEGLEVLLEGDKRQFNIKPCSKKNHFGLPYDYESILHYSARGFGKIDPDQIRGLVTIETKDPTKQHVIGQSSNLSPIDIEKIKRFYGCVDRDRPFSLSPTPGPTSDPQEHYIPHDNYEGVPGSDLRCGGFRSRAAIQQYCDGKLSCRGFSYTRLKGWWCAKTTAGKGVHSQHAIWYEKTQSQSQSRITPSITTMFLHKIKTRTTPPPSFLSPTPSLAVLSPAPTLAPIAIHPTGLPLPAATYPASKSPTTITTTTAPTPAPCTCSKLWIMLPCEQAQYGCPKEACDGAENPSWCRIAEAENSGCAGEENKNGWMYCTADASPDFVVPELYNITSDGSASSTWQKIMGLYKKTDLVHNFFPIYEQLNDMMVVLYMSDLGLWAVGPSHLYTENGAIFRAGQPSLDPTNTSWHYRSGQIFEKDTRLRVSAKSGFPVYPEYYELTPASGQSAAVPCMGFYKKTAEVCRTLPTYRHMTEDCILFSHASGFWKLLTTFGSFQTRYRYLLDPSSTPWQHGGQDFLFSPRSHFFDYPAVYQIRYNSRMRLDDDDSLEKEPRGMGLYKKIGLNANNANKNNCPVYAHVTEGLYLYYDDQGNWVVATTYVSPVLTRVSEGEPEREHISVYLKTEDKELAHPGNTRWSFIGSEDLKWNTENKISVTPLNEPAAYPQFYVLSSNNDDDDDDTEEETSTLITQIRRQSVDGIYEKTLSTKNTFPVYKHLLTGSEYQLYYNANGKWMVSASPQWPVPAPADLPYPHTAEGSNPLVKIALQTRSAHQMYPTVSKIWQFSNDGGQRWVDDENNPFFVLVTLTLTPVYGYQTMPVGKCLLEDLFIPSRAECEQAAAHLELDDEDGVAGTTVTEGRPAGCYFKRTNPRESRLWFNALSTGIFDSADTGRVSVCRMEEYSCTHDHCLNDDYIEGVDYGFYSSIPYNGNCNSCRALCTADSNCGAVECMDNRYCSWWAVGRCSTSEASSQEAMMDQLGETLPKDEFEALGSLVALLFEAMFEATFTCRKQKNLLLAKPHDDHGLNTLNAKISHKQLFAPKGKGKGKASQH